MTEGTATGFEVLNELDYSVEKLTEHFPELTMRSKMGLVSDVLGLSGRESYSDVELQRTERGLEKEIRRESFVPPPGKKLARLRRQGERVLHSKQVLLLVVILNLVDCGLVLGELILDIHYIRELRGETEEMLQNFIDSMGSKYSENLQGYSIKTITQLHERIYQANCQWPKTPGNHGHVADDHSKSLSQTKNNSNTNNLPENLPVHTPAYTISHHINTERETSRNRTNVSEAKESLSEMTDKQRRLEEEHTLWEDIAHGLHKASITILGILFIENIMKLMCMGSAFFSRKLEVFDSVVVSVSFVVDLVLLKGLTEFAVQDALFILSFLLPWRVIRVVNSLIVAVLDHEHFRLKMLYKEKKIVTERLRTLKEKERRWEFHLQKIESFCESEGIPKWKIRQHTAMGRKQSTITSMASLALNGFLQGMILSPSDKDMLDKTIERSIALNNQYVPPLKTDATGESAKSENKCDSTEIKQGGYTSLNSETKETKIKSNPREKRVSFNAKEEKPLLRRQESIDTERTITSVDEEPR